MKIEKTESGKIIKRSGLLPYTYNNATGLWHYMFCKRTNKPESKWMIAKGHRRVYLPDLTHRDITDIDITQSINYTLEPLDNTATREGEEELGFSTPKEVSPEPFGIVYNQFFNQETRKYQKEPFFLYLVQIDLEQCSIRKEFSGKLGKDRSTGFWATLREFQKHGRLDHYEIVKAIDNILTKKF